MLTNNQNNLVLKLNYFLMGNTAVLIAGSHTPHPNILCFCRRNNDVKTELKPFTKAKSFRKLFSACL